MKRILFIALVLLAGSATTSLYAQKKGKKGKKDVPVQLLTRSDSVSYASAKMFNRGFDEYLKQNFDLDSATVDDFLRGFDEYVANKDSKQQRAYMAGQSVADMVLRRFIPNVQNDFQKQNVRIDDNLFLRGFRDGIEKQDGPLSSSASEQYMQNIARDAEEAQKQHTLETGRQFLAENAKKEGVITTPSGLQYRILRQGNGPIPKEDDEVTVKYEGKLIDGTVFDSSYNRMPNTAVFTPNRLIKGWTEALCMMPEGSKWELFVPQELGYGDRPAGKIPPYSTLIFTLELDNVKSADATADTAAEATADNTAATTTSVRKPMTSPGSNVRRNPVTGAPNPGPAIHPKPKQK